MDNILAEICSELHNINMNIMELTKAIKGEENDSVIKIDDIKNIVATGPNVQTLYGCPVNNDWDPDDRIYDEKPIKITEHSYSVVRRDPNTKNLFVLSPVRIKYNPSSTNTVTLDHRVECLEAGYGQGGLWNDTIGVFDMEHPDFIKDIDHYGSFENYLRINWIDTRKIWHQQMENDILSTDEIMKLLESEG